MNEFPSLEEIDATRAARATEHEAEAKKEEQLHVENGRVRVVAEDGQAGTVPVAKLQGFLQRGGRLESHQERAERIGGGAGKAFGTGLAVGALDAAMAPTKFAGAVYGALSGNQDPFADVSGRAVLERFGQTREQLEAREEAHGGAFKAGEFGGLGVVGAGLAPLVNPAGAAVGRGLGLGAEGLGVGAHAAHAIAHVGGEVAAGVLEGAMMGASGASEEAWLKNEKLTSEHAMHSIMEFALWGGAAVGAFKALGAAPKLAKFIRRSGEESRAAASALEEAGAKIADDLSPLYARRDAAYAAEERARAAFEAIGGDSAVSDMKHAESFARKLYGGNDEYEAWQLAKAAVRAADNAVNAAEAATSKVGATAEGVLGRSETAQKGLLDAVLPEKVAKPLREYASGFSDEAAVKAVFRGDQVALKRLGIGAARRGSQERVKELGRLLNESGIVGGSDASMLERARLLAEREGPKVGQIVRGIDAAGARPDAARWLGEIEAVGKRIVEEGVTPEAESVAKFVTRQTKIIGDEARAGTLTYERLWKFRRLVDESLDFGRETPKLIDQAKWQLRNISEQEIERGVGAVNNAGQEGLLGEYLKAKKLFGVAMDALPALAKRVERRANANMTFGLTGNVLGAGSIAATALGHPAALAVPLAAKVVRERGWSAAAVLARKIAGEAVDVTAAPAASEGSARLLRTLVSAGEQRIQKSITGFLAAHEEQAIGGAVKAVLSKVPKESLAERLKLASGDIAREHYAEHAAHVAEVTGSPDVAQARVSQALGHGLATSAPKLYGAMAAQAGSVAQFLKSKMPMPGMDPNNLTPHVKRTPPISDAALAQYRESYEGATDPLSVLDDMHNGRVSDDKIEAVKTLWPAVYASIQRTVLAELGDMKEPLPYEKALLLDRMFGANGAIASDMKPESLQAMQETAGYLAQQQQAKHPSPSAHNPMAKSMQPMSEALAGR